MIAVGSFQLYCMIYSRFDSYKRLFKRDAAYLIA
jgi:hypothetical protein